MLISIVAVLMVHESPVHLLIVPIYRLIYEPLRAYVVFGSAILALRGTAVGWYKPERTNSVAAAGRRRRADRPPRAGAIRRPTRAGAIRRPPRAGASDGRSRRCHQTV